MFCTRSLAIATRQRRCRFSSTLPTSPSPSPSTWACGQDLGPEASAIGRWPGAEERGSQLVAVHPGRCHEHGRAPFALHNPVVFVPVLVRASGGGEDLAPEQA